jgi:hypothetical protein
MEGEFYHGFHRKAATAWLVMMMADRWLRLQTVTA